jgi:hypothetical protein
MANDRQHEIEAFTQRSLMAMATELAEHLATGERLRIQFEALAKAHGVTIPPGGIDN